MDTQIEDVTFRTGKLAGLIAVVALLFASVALLDSPANAVSASCTAVKQTESGPGLDSHRARAICSRIASDTKVRAKLVRNAANDYEGSWFTTINKYYYSGWATCYAGCSARYDVTAR